MATVSSLGVGAGIDLNSLLSKLVDAESIPITQLDTKQTSYKNQLSAIGRIQSAVDAMTTAATAINSPTAFEGFQANVADTSYASATATSFASPGSYTLRVDQLAQANKLQSGVTPSVSAGSLTIELGDISSGSFVAKSGTSPVTVNFTGSTLDDLRSAINSAGAGVTASIINGTAGQQLILTSDETGASNTIKLTGTSGLSGLTYDPISPSSAFTSITDAQDAQAHIDGVLVSSSTNTLSDVMTGVSVTLTKANDPANPADSTTLTVGNDTAGMTNKINAFISAWNNLNSLTKTLTQYDSTNSSASVLTGDGTVRTVTSTLRNVLFSSPTGASSTYPTLADLGISIQSDGSMKLDSATFDTALSTNLSAVSATVSAFGTAFETATQGLTDAGGAVATREDALNTLISNLDTRRTEMQAQIDATKARYQKQFTALDVIMSQFQTQSAYLTQQLAKL